MRIAVIVSKKDEAGMNIRNFLLDYFKEDKYKEAKLYTIEKDTIYFDEAENLEEELVIFATKHSSKQGQPALSCHTSGNWGPADYGGKPYSFSTAPALLLREIMLDLEQYSSEREIFQEVTHHGPTIKKLSLFIEIGSTKEEWVKEENGKKIAKTIIKMIDLLEGYGSYKNFIKDYRNKNGTKVALAIGGLHHMPNFKKLYNFNIAIGHTCAKYNLDDFDEETLEKAINATAEKADLIIVDWKGLARYKVNVSEILNKKEMKWKKTKEITSSLLS